MRRIISGCTNASTSSEKLYLSGVGERQSRRMETLTRLPERDKKKRNLFADCLLLFLLVKNSTEQTISHLYLLIYSTESRCIFAMQEKISKFPRLITIFRKISLLRISPNISKSGKKFWRERFALSLFGRSGGAGRGSGGGRKSLDGEVARGGLVLYDQRARPLRRLCRYAALIRFSSRSLAPADRADIIQLASSLIPFIHRRERREAEASGSQRNVVDVLCKSCLRLTSCVMNSTNIRVIFN